MSVLLTLYMRGGAAAIADITVRFTRGAVLRGRQLVRRSRPKPDGSRPKPDGAGKQGKAGQV